MVEQINPKLPIRGDLKCCTYLVYCRCADYGSVPHWHYCQAASARLDPALLEQRCWQHESKQVPANDA